MKRVFSEPAPLFIHQIKVLLEEKGITTIIKNEFLSGGVGELPPTEVWPELWVMDKADSLPAERIVEKFIQSTQSNPQDWICKGCGEKIEGQFNMCWSCGGKSTLS